MVPAVTPLYKIGYFRHLQKVIERISNGIHQCGILRNTAILVTLTLFHSLSSLSLAPHSPPLSSLFDCSLSLPPHPPLLTISSPLSSKLSTLVCLSPLLSLITLAVQNLSYRMCVCVLELSWETKGGESSNRDDSLGTSEHGISNWSPHCTFKKKK